MNPPGPELVSPAYVVHTGTYGAMSDGLCGWFSTPFRVRLFLASVLASFHSVMIDELTECCIHKSLVSDLLLACLLLEEKDQIIIQPDCDGLLLGSVKPASNTGREIILFLHVEVVGHDLRFVFFHSLSHPGPRLSG